MDKQQEKVALAAIAKLEVLAELQAKTQADQLPISKDEIKLLRIVLELARDGISFRMLNP